VEDLSALNMLQTCGVGERRLVEARKRLKKEMASKEAVGKANLIVLRPVAYVIRSRSYVYLSVFNLVHFST
jgi:hypothetical protein